MALYSNNPTRNAGKLTSHDPTITQGGGSSDTSVNPNTGNLSLTGYAPTIAISVPVNPSQGEIIITGLEPTVHSTSPNIIYTEMKDVGKNHNVPYQEIEVTFNEPVAMYNNVAGILSRLNPSPGYALTDPTNWLVIRQNGSTDITLTYLSGDGTDKWVVRAAVAILPTDDVVIHHREAALRVFNIVPDGTSISSAERLAPYFRIPVHNELTDNTETSPNLGEITITGYEPQVIVSGAPNPIEVEPNTGEITLTSYEPTVLVNVSVDPNKGDITLTGYAPDVEVSNHKEVTPESGTISLTGYEPTISISISVVPNTATVNLIGYEPTVQVSNNVTIVAGTGESIITGYRPTVFGDLPTAPPISTPPRHTPGSSGGGFEGDFRLIEQGDKAWEERKRLREKRKRIRKEDEELLLLLKNFLNVIN